MELNANFDQRVLVHSSELAWRESPMAGVQRRMLDRLGDEVARATTIVSYAPGSDFSPHVHTGGEEFLVLDGVFQDEHGDFPAGSYIRNPPESRHTPGSKPGCVIFVKLWQFDLADRTHVRTDYNKIGRISDSMRPGVELTPLYQDNREMVRIEHWSEGTVAMLDATHGAEVLVLDGEVSEGHDLLHKHSWLRLPLNTTTTLSAGSKGATLWLKTGHLRYVSPPVV